MPSRGRVSASGLGLSVIPGRADLTGADRATPSAAGLRSGRADRSRSAFPANGSPCHFVDIREQMVRRATLLDLPESRRYLLCDGSALPARLRYGGALMSLEECRPGQRAPAPGAAKAAGLVADVYAVLAVRADTLSTFGPWREGGQRQGLPTGLASLHGARVKPLDAGVCNGCGLPRYPVPCRPTCLGRRRSGACYLERCRYRGLTRTFYRIPISY